MLEYLCTWIENIAFYMVIITAALNVAPAKEYKKYIRFYSGLTLIIVAASPLMKIGGMEADFKTHVRDIEYRLEEEGKGIREQFKEAASRIFSPDLPENEKEEGEGTIKVRGIKVDP